MDLTEEQFSKLIESVVQSNVFGRSERQKQLFVYLMAAAREGNIERVNAYSIALDVFQRKEGFDPSEDSIVRVEMYRLRRNIDQYNLKHRTDEEPIISFDKGSFAPIIRSPKTSIDPSLDLPKKSPNDLAMARSKRVPILLLLALGLILGGSFYAQSLQKGDDVNLLRPQVLIRAPSFLGDDEEGKSIQRLIHTVYSELADAYQYIQIKREGRFDYILELSQKKNTTGNVSLRAVLFDASGTLLVSKTYPQQRTDEGGKFQFDPLKANFFSIDSGVIPTYFVNSQNRSESILNVYRCLMDGSQYFNEEYVAFNSGDELFGCLNPKDFTLADDRGLVLVQKAWLAYHQLKGRAYFNIEHPLKELDEILDELQLTKTHSVEYFKLKLARLNLDNPVDQAALRNTLSQMEKMNFQNGQGRYSMAQAYAYNIGDWSSAQHYIDKYFEMLANSDTAVDLGHFVTTLLAIMKGDYTTAYERYQYIPNVPSKAKTALEVVIRCSLDDDSSMLSLRSKLSSQGLGDPLSFSSFIEGNNYPDEMKQVFGRSEVLGCRVFG